MTVIPDHEHEHLKLRRIASVLLPGDDTSPPATSVPDYDELLSKAVEVIGAEQPMLTRALKQLPDDADWDALKEFADSEPDGFEVVAAVVSGAYFMSTTVLDALHYPHGPRRATPFGLVADELESGVLEPVMERAPMVRSVGATDQEKTR
jgi:hypothetical protein